jgi:hypothetical protein
MVVRAGMTRSCGELHATEIAILRPCVPVDDGGQCHVTLRQQPCAVANDGR